MPSEYTQILMIPHCDLCRLVDSGDRDAAYDGKTQAGPWAYMCEEHFKVHGTGLGIGRGQRLVLKKEEDADR